jgi:hypothetical protein
MPTMIGNIGSDGQTITLTTGSLSDWIYNLTPTQRSLVQVFGYDANHNQVISKTLQPVTFGYNDLGYNVNPYVPSAGDPSQLLATIAALQLDGGGYTMSRTVFKVTGNWTPNLSNIKIIICATMFDQTGLLQHSGETPTGPPYFANQNPILYNSDAYPPYFSPLYLVAYDSTHVAFTLSNPLLESPITIGNIAFAHSNPYVDPRGHQIGAPIYGGGGFGDLSGYSLNKKSIIVSNATIGGTTYTTDLSASADPATIVVQGYISKGSGSNEVRYGSSNGQILYNVYSHCNGAGFFGSDGGMSTRLGSMGIPNATIIPYTDCFWESYPGQPRADNGSANPYTHTSFGIQYTDNIANTEMQFYAGAKDTPAPITLIPKDRPDYGANLGTWIVAGQTAYVPTAIHAITEGGWETTLYAVTNIAGSVLNSRTYNCTTVAGSRTVTVNSATAPWGSQATYGSDPGGIIKYHGVSGAGIPTQAYVGSVSGSTTAPFTFQIDRPATISATNTLTFSIYAANTPDQWVWTELPNHPWVEGLQRNGGGFTFYSDPTVSWTLNGQTVCGDGYIYTYQGTFDSYYPAMQQQTGSYYAYRVKYADLFTGEPFGTGEWYLGTYAGNWTGSAAKSYVVVNADGTTTTPETSGWVAQNIVQNDRHLLSLKQPLIKYNGDGGSITQRSDGTYLAVSRTTYRHFWATTTTNLSGWGNFGTWSYFGPVPYAFGYDASNYMNSDGAQNANKYWAYGAFLRSEVTWQGQGVDDFCVSHATHDLGGNLYDPMKYWTKLWVVSGL